MNNVSPVNPEAFPRSSYAQRLTFQDVIDSAKADPALTESRRHNVVSSIRRVCALFLLDPAVSAANHQALRRHVERFEPLRAGIKQKRFRNMLSDVNFAIKRYALRRPWGTKGLTPEWTALRSLLKGTRLDYALPGFIRFCSVHGVAPPLVSDAIVSDYGDWLCNETFRTKPKTCFRNAIRDWNKAAAAISAWPKITLTVPSHRKPYCLPWAALSSSFRADVDAYLMRLIDPDPFDVEAPPRPARPATIETYRFQIRQLVSALAITGHDVQRITQLGDLVRVENATDALRFFHERGDKQVAQLAILLHKIARYWCKVDGPALERLTVIKRNLTRNKVRGLTAKNRERLRPFTDRHSIEDLLLLPSRIYARIKRVSKIKLSDLADVQVALALELLLMAPIRRSNLVKLRIGSSGHIRRAQDRKSTTHIIIPGHEVKNGEDLEFPLPRETTALVDVYLNHYRLLLPSADSEWLFPGEGGRHKSLDHFSRQFTKSIRRHTGLVVNMHLMRHLGAKLYLDRNPGAYELIRRVLAHRSVSTTLDTYTGTETEAAVRHFDSVILGIRNSIVQETSRD